MATRDLLLEIGVEELPARFCGPALAQLKEKAEAALAAARLDHGPVETFGTPRRLVLLVRDLALRQRDQEVVVRGPSRRAAFDAEGRPTRAAEGFARSQGVPVESLVVRTDEKGGEYVYAVKHEAGQPAAEVLPALLERLITSLEFPKSMRWGTGEIRFARPIRWILALLGDEVIPFTVAGLESGRTTRGHRTLGPAEPIPVDDVHDYFVKVARAGVMVDQEQRRRTIWHQVSQVARELGGWVPRDEALLDEITWLVEQPLAFHGNFDPAFLEVPQEVLVTSMREHQRYFPVYDREDGRLLPYFIAVRNGGEEHLETVRRGNERVLRARLADARFFFEEDRKRPLESRLKDLKQIVFQEKLGSLYDKVQRLRALARQIGEALGFGEADLARCDRVATLAKCDLTTHVVYEFPELQGVMGREYARLEGEDPEVTAGIFEHYLPRFAGDRLPGTAPGTVVALADKLDTLAGFFLLGLIPTGSQDPYALRRAALGVTAIVTEGELRLSLSWLLDAALAGYGDAFTPEERSRAKAALLDFFRVRLEGLLREQGHRPDVVDAVLAAGMDDMVDLLRRAEALTRSLQEPEFAAVTTAFKRVANLAVKAAEHGAAEAEVDPSLFAEEPERELWQTFGDLREAAEAALAAGDYLGFYRLAVRLKAPVDAFLDRVLVMAEDPALRRNRLAMLRAIGRLLTRPADLGRLSVG
ncbi:MAG: glycine--tRNA ligase subunit beta [Bacillota bacterium]